MRLAKAFRLVQMHWGNHLGVLGDAFMKALIAVGGSGPVGEVSSQGPRAEPRSSVDSLPTSAARDAMEVEEVEHGFHIRLRARVRAEPSPAAEAVGFLEVGECVRGVRHGRWVELRSTAFSGGFVLGQFADGEMVLTEEPG